MNTQPIGILDSGVGGLSVWGEIVHLLPHESTVYIGDSLHTPYGTRSHEEIYLLAKQLVEFLLSKNVKAVVIACNTITVSCLDRLRADYPEMPIIGTVPVIKTAATITKDHRIGILSTTRTAASEYQKKLIQEFASDCVVSNYGTDDLVPLIEKGEVTGENVRRVLTNVLAAFQKDQVDTLALGCTHFPFVREEIETILGSDITVLDSGAAIARQVKRVLENNSALADETSPKHLLYTTGDSDMMKQLAKTVGKGTITSDVLVEKITLI